MNYRTSNHSVKFMTGIGITVSMQKDKVILTEGIAKLQPLFCYRIIGQAEDGAGGSKILTVGSFWDHVWPYRTKQIKIEKDWKKLKEMYGSKNCDEIRKDEEVRCEETNLMYLTFPQNLVGLNVDLFHSVGPYHVFMIGGSNADPNRMRNHESLRLANEYLRLQ